MVQTCLEFNQIREPHLANFFFLNVAHDDCLGWELYCFTHFWEFLRAFFPILYLYEEGIKILVL